MSQSYQIKEGVKLGVWLSNQSQAHHKGELSKERQSKLVTMGGALKPKTGCEQHGSGGEEEEVEEECSDCDSDDYSEAESPSALESTIK